MIDPFTQAVANLNDQNFIMAIDGFNKAVAAGINGLLSMKMRSQAFFFANKYQSAVASYQQMIQKFPNSQQGYHGKAFSMGFLGQQSLQIDKLYQKAIHLNQSNWKIYFNKGYTALRAKKIDQALSLFQQSITKNSLNDPISFICQAEAFCMKKNFVASKKNIQYARKALQDRQNHKILYKFQIKKIYQLLDHYEKDLQNIRVFESQKKIKPQTRDQLQTNLTKQLSSSILLNNSIIFRQFSQKMSTSSTDDKNLTSFTNITTEQFEEVQTPWCNCKCAII